MQEVAEASRWFVEAGPLVPFYANVQAGVLFQHLAGKGRVHVVDLGTAMVSRWNLVFDLITAHPGSAPGHLHLTLLDLTPLLHPRRRSMKSFLSKKWYFDSLHQEAEAAGVLFSLEKIDLQDYDIRGLLSNVRRRGSAETVIVCTSFHLMHVPDAPGPGASPSPRDSVLKVCPQPSRVEASRCSPGSLPMTSERGSRCMRGNCTVPHARV